MAALFSTTSGVAVVDTRVRPGTITLPLTTQIPNRYLQIKDLYGAFGVSSLTLSTQTGESFDDRTTSKILTDPFSFMTLYAASTGRWAVLGGTQTIQQTMSSLIVSSINGAVPGSGTLSLDNLQSTVQGLGSSGYVSTLSLFSSTQGLQREFQTAGFLSSPNLLSTTGGLQVEFLTAGFLSSLNLLSTTEGLGSSGYISSASLESSLISTIHFISESFSSFSTAFGPGGGINTANLTSTVEGLGESGYVSTLSLISTTNFISESFSSFSTSYGFQIVTSSLVASNVSSFDIVGNNVIAQSFLQVVDGILSVQNSSGLAPITAAFGTSNLNVQLVYEINEEVKWSQVVTDNSESPLSFVYKQTTELLTLDGKGERVGIYRKNPAYALDVSGTVNADFFIGDGSGLSNLPSGLSANNLISTVEGLGTSGYISSGGQGYFSTVFINMLPQDAPFWDSNVPAAGFDPEPNPLALDIFGSARILKNIYIGSTTTIIGTGGIVTGQVSSQSVLASSLLLYNPATEQILPISLSNDSLIFNGSNVVTFPTNETAQFVSTPFLNETLISTVEGLGNFYISSIPQTLSTSAFLTSSLVASTLTGFAIPFSNLDSGSIYQMKASSTQLNFGYGGSQAQIFMGDLLSKIGNSTDSRPLLLLKRGEAFPQETINFSYTGSDQSWTVPQGCTEINVTLLGAGGGGGNASNGGNGGFVQGTLAVTPGEVLTIIVGGGGGGSGSGNSYGGGANGASQSGAGGGRSAIRRSDNDVVTAGGGGGGGNTGNGGAGGGLVGGAGGVYLTYTGGGGGTQSAGGAGGSGGGNSGTQYLGGDDNNMNGGGGGGGWYGGGGGAEGSAGGGGSSYVANLSGTVVNTQGGGAAGGGGGAGSNGSAIITFVERQNRLGSIFEIQNYVNLKVLVDSNLRMGVNVSNVNSNYQFDVSGTANVTNLTINTNPIASLFTSTVQGLGSVGYLSSIPTTLSTSAFLTSSITASTIIASSLQVQSFTVGTGTGWLNLGPIQTLIVSSLQETTNALYANTAYIGIQSTVNSIQYNGLFGNYNNTVLAEVSTGGGNQEFLVFKGSSSSDRIRFQTTGNFVIETGVSARLWSNTTIPTLSNATSAFFINTSSNVGIQCNAPGTTLDVNGTARALLLSSQQIFTSSIFGNIATFATLSSFTATVSSFYTATRQATPMFITF